MDAFFYYSDLMAQARLAQPENTIETGEIAEAQGQKKSLFARIGEKLEKWFVAPVSPEVAEAYHQGQYLLPMYPY